MKQIFKFAGALFLTLALVVAFTFPAKAVYWDLQGTNLLIKGFIEIPEISSSTPGTPGATSWRLYTYNDGVYIIDDAGSATNLLSSTTLDAAYTGGNTITLDASGDLEFDLSVTARNVKLANTFAGVQAVGLEIDAETAYAVTDGILFSSTAGTFTDAIDASDTGITNALNVGANVIIGGLASIDFTEFDVSGTTGAITINDDGDAGSITIESTVLDINSLDFVGAGTISAGASSAITINPDGGNAAGEDLIITAENIQLTATGAITMSPDAAVTTALTITDTDYTNALSVGANAIIGTTGIINYTNFDVAADGDVDCVDLDASGNIVAVGNITGATITGATIAQDAIIAVTPNTNLDLDGSLTTGGVDIGTTGGSGAITMGGSGYSTLVSLPAAVDLTMAGGQLSITDTANADLVTLVNDTVTTNDIIDISAGGTRTAGGVIKIVDGATTASTITIVADSATTGNVIAVQADALEAGGAMIYLDSDAIPDTNTFYIEAAGTGTDWTLAKDGVMVSSGVASTDVITITAGDIQVTAGDIDVDNGNLMVDTTQDLGSNISRNFAGAGGTPTLSVVETHASSTNSALSVSNAGTAGTGLTVTASGTSDATGIAIVHSGDFPALNITAGAARTGNVIDIAMANQLNQNGMLIDGLWTGASDLGMINLNPSGSIAAGASALRIDYDTGTPAASGFGIEIDDDSADGGTFYALLINSANNEGLHVEAGLSLFAELVTFTAGVDVDGNLDVDLSANTERATIETTAQDWPAGSGLLQIHGDHAGNTSGDMALLRLVYQGDGIANDAFIEAVDNSTGADANGDVQFKVDSSGDITTAGTLTVNGATAVGDGATQMYGFVSLPVDGGAGPVNIEIADSGKVYYNSEACQFNLPAAAAGLKYTFVVAHASQITIEPDGTDRILILTDTNGDKITSSTQGDTVTLIATGAGFWWVQSIFPTNTDWADGGA